MEIETKIDTTKYYSYLEEILNNLKNIGYKEEKIVNLEHSIKYGNDEYEKFIGYNKKYLETFGYDKKSCQEILNENNENINDIIRIVTNKKEQNQKLLSRLLKNKEQLQNISKLYYKNEDKDNLNKFIKEILATTGESRKVLRNNINSIVLENLNKTTSKSKLGDLDEDISKITRNRINMYYDINNDLTNTTNEELATMLAELYAPEYISDNDIERKI